MKNIFKKSLNLAIICLLILLSSCEAEKDFAKSEKIIVRKFSMRETAKNGNSKLTEAVNKIKNMQSSETNINSKIVFDQKSGLYFDDEKGIYIEVNDKKSYTFPIIRTSATEKVQNICFNLKPNGNYDVFLVKYDFTKEEASGLSDEDIKNRGKEFITLLKDGQVVNLYKYVCIDLVMYVTTDIAPPLDQGDLTGNFGTNPGTSTTVVTIASGCFFTSDSGGGGEAGDGFNNGFGNGDGGDSGSTSGGGGIADDAGIITGSIISDTEAQIPGSMPLGWLLEFFEDNLDEYSLPIYNQYPSLRDILAANDCNYISQQVVLQIISDLSNGAVPLNLEDFDEHITPINLPPCINTILNDIKNLNSEKFSDVIKLFTQKNPVALDYNWHIRKGTLPNNTPAATTAVLINGTTAFTTINEAHITLASELSIAKTLMHEAFHGYLLVVFQNINVDNNYATLIDKYAKLFDPDDDNDLHHYLFIKLNIVDEITKTLKEYGISKGYDFSDEYYEDMAWSGLRDTQAFNQLSEERQERIINRDAAEFNSENYNGYSPQTPRACP